MKIIVLHVSKKDMQPKKPALNLKDRAAIKEAAVDCIAKIDITLLKYEKYFII